MEQNIKGVLVLIVENADCPGQWLVQRRTKPGEPVVWELPQGKIQAGETLVQASRRELHEESGLHLTRILTPGVEPNPAQTMTAFVPFVPFAAVLDLPEQELVVCLLAEARGDPVATEEACDHRWCDAAALRELLQNQPVYPTNRALLERFLAQTSQSVSSGSPESRQLNS
jgi:8-oxo-dGTP pyrophosphatase MutT (NUDIX family)